jgi:hypothetical protein
MAVRFTATFKGTGGHTTQGRTQNNCFFWMDDETTDAQALTAAQLIAGLCNGELVGVSKQIFVGDLVGPWTPLLTANGGSSRAQLLFRSNTRKAQTITLPFQRHNITREAVEAVFETEANGFLNEFGEPLGRYVNTRTSEVVDGA